MAGQLESQMMEVYGAYQESLGKFLKTLRWEANTKVDALTAATTVRLPGDLDRGAQDLARHIRRAEERWLKTSVPAYISQLRQTAITYLWEQIPEEAFRGRQSQVEEDLEQALESAWGERFPRPRSLDLPSSFSVVAVEPLSILTAALLVTAYIWATVQHWFLRFIGGGSVMGGGVALSMRKYVANLGQYRSELHQSTSDHLDEFQRAVEDTFRETAQIAAKTTEEFVERIRLDLPGEDAHGPAR